MTTHHGHHLSSTMLVERYLSFFTAHGHLKIAGSPLAIPGHTTSFIIAGMQPLLPYLRGQTTPPASRLTSLQRCLRSDDADAVGLNGRKNTAFHMLGNWSLNNYGKEQAIALAHEFLWEQLALPQEKLWVTVFAGDPEMCLLPDQLAIDAWRRAGIAREQIVMLGIEDNFWTMGGGPGPCGPCTEIFVDRGLAYGCGRPTCQPGCACERFLEIWNLVFMEYERFADGTKIPLPQRNIDTGMGLERIAAVLQDVESVFAIDLFQPAARQLLELAPTGSTGDNAVEKRARRLILDHTRAALLALLADVMPGRDGRNSVVRRLLRRAARQGRVLGLRKPFLGGLLIPLAEGHRGLLTEEEYQRIPELVQVIDNEEQLFARVLTTGLRDLALLEPDRRGMIPGELLFKMHAEKGFPSDLAGEILAERGLTVDWSSYTNAELEHHRVSRSSSSTHFRTV